MGSQNLGKVRGQSAYELWLTKSGNSGKSEVEFLASLKGTISDVYDYQVINGTHCFKYVDGRLEMHNTRYMKSECKRAFGSYFIADVEQWIFPIKFIGAPTVQVTCVGGIDFGFAVSGNNTINGEQVTYTVATKDNMSGTGKKPLVSLYAIGRWK